MRSTLKRPVTIMLILFSIVSIVAISFYSNTIKAIESKKTIGVLVSSYHRMSKVEGLKKGLERYKFVEGNNVNYFIKNANSDPEVLPRLAKELVSEHPDVIFVTGTAEAIAAHTADQTAQIPIVFVGVSSAKDIGLVKSIDFPGENITGVETYYTFLSGKRLEFFKRLLPGIKNISVMYDPRIIPIQPTKIFLDEVSRKLDLSLQWVPVETQEKVLQVMNKLDAKQVDGVMFLCSELLESINVSQIALEKRIPVMGVNAEQTLNGLLASYGTSYCEQGLQASRLVAKVLKGENASSIPVEGPEKVEFILNQKTAKKLQINLNPGGLACVSKFVE